MYEQRLQENLVIGYNTLVRPVEKNDDQLVVRLGLKLIQLLDVVLFLKNIISSYFF